MNLGHEGLEYSVTELQADDLNENPGLLWKVVDDNPAALLEWYVANFGPPPAIYQTLLWGVGWLVFASAATGRFTPARRAAHRGHIE